MRIQSIDYLRGLMSLSIVLYHFSTTFTTWGLNDSSELLGKLGIYAVSAFYIISGMALYLAHKNDHWDRNEYFIFIARRFFRLAPIYWLALLALTVFYFLYVPSFSIDNWKYAQNILLIFGVTNPAEYLIMGGWSIGNEVVFYLFFPIIILMTRNRVSIFLLTLLSVLICVYCSAFYLDPNVSLGKQWLSYINPFNQIYFFAFGVVAAKYLLPYVARYKRLYFLGVLASFATFYCFPVYGDQISIVTGINKIIFTTSIFLLCCMFFLIGDLTKTGLAHKILKFMGDVSYPLYLLHGVSFMYFRKIVVEQGMPDTVLVGYGLLLLLILLMISWLCHIGIEKPIIKLSKRMVIRRTRNKEPLSN